MTESIKEHGVYNVRVEISDELNTIIKVIVHDPEQTPEELLSTLNTETKEESTEEIPSAEEESTEEKNKN